MQARIETVIYETPGQVCKAKAQELCRMILDFARKNPDTVPAPEKEPEKSA